MLTRTTYFNKLSNASPLVVFRFVLGILLFISTIRFWLNGWIHDLYIAPKYFFPYFGFEFIKPLGNYTYLLFLVCGVSALLVAIGLFYRAAIITLFASFTYIEFMDKSTYLNHYYFVSMICFIMIFLPANISFSIDSLRKKNNFSSAQIPTWCINAIKIFVGLLYFYAGLAKLNSDWLLHAMPLKIWLVSKNDTAIIGWLFNYNWVAFAFSWFGCLYDLSIPFLLWNKKTLKFAYVAVIVFHILTSVLFPIGVFPYVMITTALIFFPAEFHQKIINYISSILKFEKKNRKDVVYMFSTIKKNIIITCLSMFFVFQIVFPFRYLLYDGELFWTEEGYRFSWRVMLMEKSGNAEFLVKDAKGKLQYVNNEEFLTTLQIKMMATQPDMILQYAHVLKEHYAKNGFVKPEVYVDSYVTLNGRLGKQLIDPNVDLAKEKESFKHKTWILPLNDEIKGF